MFKLNSNVPHISVGVRGEKAAINYLKALNYIILETNFCNKTGRRIGEIDIIAKEKDEIVFIEVKTRKQSPWNDQIPEENINHAKLYKLNKIASYYIASRKLYSTNYRLDAISIIANLKTNKAQLRHIKNIFI
jgi:putative endonuclease